MKNLRSWKYFYMTAGRDHRDKSQVCLPPPLRSAFRDFLGVCKKDRWFLVQKLMMVIGEGDNDDLDRLPSGSQHCTNCQHRS